MKKDNVIFLLTTLSVSLISVLASAATVGWWHFDEGSGTTVFDSSNYANHGTLGDGTTMMPNWVSGHNGSALDFEADDNDYVLVPNSTSLTMAGTGAFTVQCWVKPESWTHNCRIVDKNYYGFWQVKDPNDLDKIRVQLYFNEDSTYKWFFSNGTIPMNEWTHIALTYDGTDIKVYLNGSEDTVVNYPDKTLKGATNDLKIGNGRVTIDKPFDGIIDEVRIDSVDLFSIPDSFATVGWWHFDQSSGITVFDSSNYANHGTLGDGTTMMPDWVSGYSGNALDFEADDNDYVLIPDSASLDMAGTSAFTVQCWVKPESWTHNCRIVDKNYYGFWQVKDPNDLDKIRVQLYFNEDSTFKWFFSNGTIPMNEWTHIALTYDGTDIKVYLNGSEDTVVNYPNKTLKAATNDLKIGNGRVTIDKPFDGIIDEVRIDNVDLFAPCETSSTANGSHNAELDVELVWPVGEMATASYLYFGDNLQDVNSATDPYMLPGRGRFELCQDEWLDPYGLDYRSTYYWRVDEVNEITGEMWKGQIRQFTTKKFLPEDITDDNRVDILDLGVMVNKWLDQDDTNEFDPADITRDGVVNLTDFASLMNKWHFSGTTYYVSSIDGNDNNSGTSPAEAWATLNAVNSRTFDVGDKILFKAGTQYTGRLVANGSGVKGFPIIIDKYGDGAKPRIDGNSLDMEALLLYNVQYWEVNNLEITNRTPQVPDLAGVRVHIDDFGKARHIYLRNLYVHDVNAPHSNRLSETGYGIYWRNGGSAVPSVFDDLRIEDCHVERVNCRGIQGRSQYSRSRGNWHPSINVVIRGNLVEQIGGAGITTLGTHGALIEYNRVDGIGIFTQGNGIHPYSADNTVIQYNEVSDCRTGTTEGWGFNSDDKCRNSLFQYNYSHDNEGGFQLVIGNDCESTVVRYNISQNDGFNTGLHSPTFNLSLNCRNTRIYNNTIYVGTRKVPIELIRCRTNVGDPWPDNTQFYNNIFYVDGQVTFTLGSSTNNVFSNNVWYGNIIDPPYDPCAITADPLLVDPNSGGEDLNFDWDLLSGYQLQAGSPCIGTGTIVDIDPNNYKYGDKDFWGNPIPDGITNPDVGAHQYQGV